MHYGFNQCGYDPCFSYGYNPCFSPGFCYPGYGGWRGGFALIVVLFILLIIIGASYYSK